MSELETAIACEQDARGGRERRQVKVSGTGRDCGLWKNVFLVPSGPGGGNRSSRDPAGDILTVMEEGDKVSERLRE